MSSTEHRRDRDRGQRPAGYTAAIYAARAELAAAVIAGHRSAGS
jgi:thioredoxin reductase